MSWMLGFLDSHKNTNEKWEDSFCLTYLSREGLIKVRDGFIWERKTVKNIKRKKRRKIIVILVLRVKLDEVRESYNEKYEISI